MYSVIVFVVYVNIVWWVVLYKPKVDTIQISLSLFFFISVHMRKQNTKCKCSSKPTSLLVDVDNPVPLASI